MSLLSGTMVSSRHVTSTRWTSSKRLKTTVQTTWTAPEPVPASTDSSHKDTWLLWLPCRLQVGETLEAQARFRLAKSHEIADCQRAQRWASKRYSYTQAVSVFVVAVAVSFVFFDYLSSRFGHVRQKMGNTSKHVMVSKRRNKNR